LQLKQFAKLFAIAVTLSFFWLHCIERLVEVRQNVENLESIKMRNSITSRFFRFGSVTTFCVLGLNTLITPVQANPVLDLQEEVLRRGIPPETVDFAMRNSGEFPAEMLRETSAICEAISNLECPITTSVYYEALDGSQAQKDIHQSNQTDVLDTIRWNSKGADFAAVTVQGYTIPVCTESGVALEQNSFNDTLYIGNYAIAHQGNEYLGRLSVLQIICKVMEFRTERSNYTDFLLVWQNFLENFNATFVLAEGRLDGPYALYRLVYPDSYVQYIAVYSQPAGSLQLSVGSFPRDEELSRQSIVLMMAESGLGRPGLE